VDQPWTPTLELRQTGQRCRLWIGGRAYGDGATLQEAADDLVARLLVTAMAIRASGLTWSPEGGSVDRPWLDFLWELGELASGGHDIRQRLFGPAE
jgi:hypothetical protein